MEKYKAKDVQKLFSDLYGRGVGVVDGGDGVPVQVTMTVLSCNTARAHEFGCPQDEMALLVEFVPAGMTYDESDPESWPKEAGVDPARLPPKDQWLAFPRKLGGLPIFYKRGQQAFAG